MVLGSPCFARVRPSGRSSADGLPAANPAAPTSPPAPFVEPYGNPLRIKIYYILCSSAESTPIIVARPNRRKRFLIHRGGAGKEPKNQGLSSEFCYRSPNIHRRSTVLSTVAVDNLSVAVKPLRVPRPRASAGASTLPIVGRSLTGESEPFRLYRYPKRCSLGMIAAIRVGGCRRAATVGWLRRAAPDHKKGSQKHG
jgi:hypothetical protein